MVVVERAGKDHLALESSKFWQSAPPHPPPTLDVIKIKESFTPSTGEIHGLGLD